MDENLGCFHVLANVNSVAAGKGSSFQGLRGGSCLTLRNGLSEETHVLTKQGNCRAARSLRFYGNWVSFGAASGQSFWLSILLVPCASLSHREDFWEVGKMYGLFPPVGWHVPPPFSPSWILLVSFPLAAPPALLGPPVVRQLRQVIIMPGQGGWFRSTAP